MEVARRQRVSRWMSAASLVITVCMTASCSAVFAPLEDPTTTLLKGLVPANASDVLETPLKKRAYSAQRDISFVTSMSQSAYENWIAQRLRPDWHLRTRAREGQFFTRLLEGEQQTITFTFDVQANGSKNVRISFTAIPT